jgi:hypothetical protein
MPLTMESPKIDIESQSASVNRAVIYSENSLPQLFSTTNRQNE